MKCTEMLLLGVGLSVLAASGDASACGGCFAPPQSVQVVTDHRMALSLSPTRTVLWDQLRYTGRPADFSWILPIRNGPEVHIDLGNNLFVQVLDDSSAPVLTPPPPPPQQFCPSESDAPRFASADAGAASPGGVQVLQESVVGPYMTATLRGDDPMALRNWLTANSYSVPAQTNAVIDYYVGLHMDFVVLKLRPGEGVDRMQPVRITSPGYAPTLPLRMIAAGVADKVGLLLMVLAPSRVEAMNFPNGQLSDDSFTYDYNAPTGTAQDFINAFDRLNISNGRRLWLTESSLSVGRSYVLGGGATGSSGGRFGGPFRPNQDFSQITDDVVAAFQGLGESATLTRMRADLGASSLDRDLNLAASEAGERARFYNYGHLRNLPPAPPPCPGFGATSAFGCSTTPAQGSRGGLLALMVGASVFAARRRRLG